MFLSYNLSFADCRKVQRVIGAFEELSINDIFFKDLLDDFNNSVREEKNYKAKRLVELFNKWQEEKEEISLKEFVFFAALI